MTTRKPPPDLDAGLPVLDPLSLPVLLDEGTARAGQEAARLARTIHRRRFAKMDSAARKSAVDHLRPLPCPGEALHLAMSGSYSGFMIVGAVVELLGERVDHLTLSTLGFNRANLEDLLLLLDRGTVRGLTLNVSTYFRASDREIFADIERELGSRGQRVLITRSHAKLLLFDTATRAIVVETSANLRSSQMWEQAVVSDDRELLNFHRAWIDALHEKAMNDAANQPAKLPH